MGKDTGSDGDNKAKINERSGAGESRITPKQQAFVDEYLVDLNATQAAIRAGYSARTAGSQAFDLLKKPEIQQAIAERQHDRQKRTEITQDRVLQELARLAFLDIRKAFNEDGSLKPIHELDDDTAAAIAGMDVYEEYDTKDAEDELEGQPHGGALRRRRGSAVIGSTKKVKLAEKKGALELLMRHMGMLNDKLKLQGDAEQPLEVRTKVVLVPPKQAAQVETKPLPKQQD